MKKIYLLPTILLPLIFCTEIDKDSSKLEKKIQPIIQKKIKFPAPTSPPPLQIKKTFDKMYGGSLEGLENLQLKTDYKKTFKVKDYSFEP